jgi:hypothetical protein
MVVIGVAGADARSADARRAPVYAPVPLCPLPPIAGRGVPIVRAELSADLNLRRQDFEHLTTTCRWIHLSKLGWREVPPPQPQVVSS